MKVVGVRGTRVPPEARAKVSPWSNSAAKRAWDLCCAVLLLLFFAPLMLIVAVGVKLTSPGTVFFRQRRPGKDSKEFTIFKFRTMVENRQQAGPVLTRAFDPRVTGFGRFMRKWKLDELPQLFNVIRGEMSFVGPRPQPTKLWQEPSIRNEATIVLSVRPGITSSTTLIFRNEEEVLAPLPSDQIEEVYLRTLMPLKLKMEIEYLNSASFSSDLRVAIQTLGRIFNRREQNDDLLKQYLPSVHRSPVPVPRPTLVSKPQEAWKPANLSALLELKDVGTMGRSASAEESTGT